MRLEVPATAWQLVSRAGERVAHVVQSTGHRLAVVFVGPAVFVGRLEVGEFALVEGDLLTKRGRFVVHFGFLGPSLGALGGFYQGRQLHPSLFDALFEGGDFCSRIGRRR